jgi:hypothetical protein
MRPKPDASKEAETIMVGQQWSIFGTTRHHFVFGSYGVPAPVF